METRVRQLLSQLGSVNLHLLHRPGVRGSKLREQIHGIAIHSNSPMLVVDGTGFLKLLVSRPGTQRPLRHMRFYIDESSLFQAILNSVEEIERSPRLSGRVDNCLSPMGEQVIRRQTTIVGHKVWTWFEILNPSSWAQVPVR